MRTNNKQKASAIFSADIHLRVTAPECRVDDYFMAQTKKLAFLTLLQKEHDCPIIDAGDVFNTWKPGEYLLQWAIKNLPDNIITIPGNHDIPSHTLSLYDKSGLSVLEAAGKVRVLKGGRAGWSFGGWQVTGFPYGEPLEETPVIKGAERSVAVVHAYVAEAVPAFIEGYTPAQLLAALPGYDVVVSGHNHQPFSVVARNGRVVVNPGSMMRTTADQADMRPRVYLWYADTNTVEAAYYPIEADVVSRAHLDKTVERDARMEAFVSRLDGAGVEVGLSFEKNCEAYLVANKVRDAVRDRVRGAVDGN